MLCACQNVNYVLTLPQWLHNWCYCLVNRQAAIDTYDEQSSEGMVLPYMQLRSAVLELLAHGPLLFVLANSGLCSVYDMGGEQHAASRETMTTLQRLVGHSSKMLAAGAMHLCASITDWFLLWDAIQHVNSDWFCNSAD
jgi:hypothetical protein